MSRFKPVVSIRNLEEYNRRKMKLSYKKHFGRLDDDHNFIENMFLEYMTHGEEFYFDPDGENRDFDIKTKRQLKDAVK